MAKTALPDRGAQLRLEKAARSFWRVPPDAAVLAAPPEPGEPAEPFVIEDYRRTIVDTGVVVEQLNGLVQTTNELLNSPGADRLVPSLVEAINEAGETSEGLVNHTVIRTAFLIVFFLIGLVIARLCSKWLELRILGDKVVA